MMKHLLFPSLLLSLFFAACTPKTPETTKEEAAHTDSLVQKLNSPELKALNKKILDNPNDATLYNERAKLYLSLRQLDESLGDARRAIAIDSNKAEYYVTMADAYFAHNNTKESKEVLERTIKRFPKDTESLLKLGELFFFVRQYEKAFDHINAALKLNDHIAKAYYLKGSIYKETGDTAKAMSSMETAVEQDNRYFDAYMSMGRMYAARRNMLALQYYDNALNVKALDPDALYAKAKFLQDVQQYDQAMALYERILQTMPDHEFAYYNMGAITFDAKKNPKAAIELFTKAINANPNYAEAYFARGACYAELHDKQNAVADYNMCLRLKPNYGPAVEGLNELN